MVAGWTRLIYRTRTGRRHGSDQRKGFTETEHARFLDAAHQQLNGPAVLVWDNLSTHVSRATRELRTSISRRVGEDPAPADAVPARPLRGFLAKTRLDLSNPRY
jgi:hypothetical protein